MFLKVATVLVTAFQVTYVIAGQIPVVDGVLGGVRSKTGAPKSAAQSSPLTSFATTPGKLRVTENSGVCETTPGIFQASGYGDLTSKESLWFWFFEARTPDPDSAPLALWLNGGPGSSSMIGLFQENGPCRIKNDSSGVTLNPNSWNEVANMLYIDQPVGVGFSHGTTEVGTSQEAASDVWNFLQIFFADSRFSKYITNEFAIWTESYGGHYGPVFAAYFLQQNAAIASGSISGIPINLKVLGIGDGLTDPLSQYPGYITYASTNRYHPLVSASTIKSANTSFFQKGGCQAQITSCYNGGGTSACSNAQSFCNDKILSPLAGNWDVYYVPTANPDPYPPDLTSYLTSSAVTSKIGSESTWTETNDDVYDNFASTGDWMTNSRLELQTVIEAGVRTIIYDGDADYILNYQGVEAMVNAIQSQFTTEFQAQPFTNFTVVGQLTGMYKNAGTFSYVRIFGAGHEVPAYQYGTLAPGQAALQFFSQIMSNQSLFST
ncbi:serine carboxypeptidase [Ramaria rubella]|nr:serine carboxypeptidase [Ramaria rubella]